METEGIRVASHLSEHSAADGCGRGRGAAPLAGAAAPGDAPQRGRGAQRRGRHWRGWLGRAQLLYQRLHRGKRTRLLLLPAVMALVAPIFIGATAPVYRVATGGRPILSRRGDGIAELCVAANGSTDCGAYTGVLDSSPGALGKSFRGMADAIFVRR
jgi:hypothetical protein